MSGIGYPAINAGIIRATHDGIVVAPYVGRGPASYVAQPGEPLLFGEGLVHPEGFVYTGNGSLWSSFSWLGSLNESRPMESQSASMVIRDSSGAVLFSGPALPSSPLTTPGSYQVELTKSLTIAGLPSLTTLTARVDSRLSDSAAPQLRCVRTTDGNGRQTPRLAAGAPAFLRFAAVDLTFDGAAGTGGYALVNEEKTTVSWRPHGASEWQPLAATVEAQEMANSREEFLALGHAPAGTLFSSDLSPATAATIGAIDLQFHVEDVAGNSLDFAIASAVVVGEGKRRAAHH